MGRLGKNGTDRTHGLTLGVMGNKKKHSPPTHTHFRRQPSKGLGVHPTLHSFNLQINPPGWTWSRFSSLCLLHPVSSFLSWPRSSCSSVSLSREEDQDPSKKDPGCAHFCAPPPEPTSRGQRVKECKELRSGVQRHLLCYF